MSAETDARFMRRALALAERGWGRVHPNPMVGAVLVKGGEVVAEGHHAEWGGPHAERVALEAAGERARGATLYVNLEPCHHTGKTGPCTEAIAAAGVGRVVYAMSDPNPEARGGPEWLRSQGIQVDSGTCEMEARELNAPHVVTHLLGRPFLGLKYAISLDARISEAPGTRTEVTSGPALQAAHRLRAGHDAILIGIGTALADDPSLTVREWRPPRKPPVRVILDSDLRLPVDAELARTAREIPVWAFAAGDAPAERADRLKDEGVEVLRVARAGEGLSLDEVLSTLGARGIRSVLCEGGGALGSAWLSAGWVDRLYLFIAPLLFGEPGVSAFQGACGHAPREWKLLDRRALGDVTLLTLSAGTATGG